MSSHLPIHGLDSTPHRQLISALSDVVVDATTTVVATPHAESVRQWPISHRWVILPPPEFTAGDGTGSLKRVPSSEGIANGVGKLTPLTHQFHPTTYGFKTSDSGEGEVMTFEKLERALWEQTATLLSPTIQDSSPALPTAHHLDDIARILRLEDKDADEIVQVLKRLAMEGGVSVNSARYKRVDRDFEKVGFEG